MPKYYPEINETPLFEINPSTIQDVNVTTVEFSLHPKIDYSAFMTKTSMFDNLLLNTMNISSSNVKSNKNKVVCLDLEAMSSDDSSSSSDNDYSDDDNKKTNRTFVKCHKPKVSPKPSPKKPLNENEKRAIIMQLNQEYANQLSSLNESVVKAYCKWKELEKRGKQCDYAMKEWMFLNKKYTTMKRRNAREIFDKVQSMNRKMNVNTNVYDLHGQGVKCGNLQYILKRIFSNEEKKNCQNDQMGKFVLDIGNEKDGDWHQHAKLLVVSFLTQRNSKFQFDGEKRYITVEL